MSPSATSAAIVLYGPPAVGKNTITTALTALDRSYVLFETIKVGSGWATGFRQNTIADAQKLRDSGDVLVEYTRNSHTYLIDRPHLQDMWDANVIPVIHLENLAAVRALRAAAGHWITVWLWCQRDISESRLKNQGMDAEGRLGEWVESDTATIKPNEFSLRLDTECTPPTQAAQLIHATVSQSASE